MKLIPFSPQYLRLGDPLPFGLRDANGRLLLAAGQAVEGAQQLRTLTAQPLFADEAESQDWRRRLAAAMDLAIRRNERLGSIASARPVQATGREAGGSAAERSIPEQWSEVAQVHEAAVRELRPGGDGLARMAAVHERARLLAARRLDASLYHLIFTAGHLTERYSSHHALLVMVIAEQAVPLLGWGPERADALGRAALTMNAAMARLQDLLACSDLTPTAEMRRQIDGHAAAGAELLERLGVDDPLWTETVRLHHDASDPHRPLAELEPARQLARLLRRVDVFSAKLSRRRTRAPMSPVQAAREACLGADGKPDEIGAALLKAVGLYPPGSFVELVCGEVGIVVSRGRRANLPWVASLVSASGSPLGEPALRDTVETRFQVRGAVAPASVKVRPPHERVLALR